MKQTKGILVLALALGLMLSAAATAVADVYSGPWSHTSRDVDFLKMQFTPTACANPIELYMFDYDEGHADGYRLFQIEPLAGGMSFSGTEAFFQKVNGNWSVFAIDPLANPGATAVLDLGASSLFGLYYRDAGPDQILGTSDDYDVSPNIQAIVGNPNQWLVTDPDLCASVLVTDAAPVPVPAAALVLCSSLAAVAALRRKN